MFEIRVICGDDDADRVSQTLTAAFRTGTPRTYPTRDGMRTRLYLTADHHPDGTTQTTLAADRKESA
ncbi:hypothetical protein E0500_031960 [Streptomyces sp. KM273126]|uniref:hypothetical protein n=1 Tax=Streptomyces sp. KM273126 TaxID=2545247 RepID=UPI00103D1D32|nr:hypothetical protein [Streptomyces sp. KM273126]MBA2811811.1 hypothetical protein [Streptomyces sp. KM273126]